MDQGEHRDELHEAEMQAIQKLGPDLKEHTELALGTFNLIGELLAHLPEEVFAARQQSLKVANGLLARLANDLRCVALLANRGYPIQGGILAATIYEIAFTIAYIGSDDGRAQKWIDHEEPTKPFEDAWMLTREGLRKLDITDADAQTAIEYRTYSQLCMNKHVNRCSKRNTVIGSRTVRLSRSLALMTQKRQLDPHNLPLSTPFTWLLWRC